MGYGHVARALFGEPWAIREDKLAAMAEVVAARLSGTIFSAEEIAERIGAAPAIRSRGRSGAIAVIPVMGTIAHRANMITNASGGTSTEQLTGALRAAVADPEIKAVVFDIESPGGSVYGIPEMFAEIMAARGTKPIIGVANDTAASAAYWLASAMDQIVVTPSGQVGSIGIIAMHSDYSRAEDAAGITNTILRSGKYKAEGNEFEPLNEEARTEIQSRLDSYYSMFVNDVARGRGRSVSDVRDGFGEGRMVMAKQAVAMGMADRVATLDQVLADLGAAAGRAVVTPDQRARAERLVEIAGMR